MAETVLDEPKWELAKRAIADEEEVRILNWLTGNDVIESMEVAFRERALDTVQSYGVSPELASYTLTMQERAMRDEAHRHDPIANQPQ